MGIFNVAVKIGAPDGSRFETVNALVDTGASLSALPGSILRRMGVFPYRQYNFLLADGREIQRDVGQTWIRVADQSVITLVMFGDEDVEPILGAYSLQGLLLAVDTPNEQLVTTQGLLM